MSYEYMSSSRSKTKTQEMSLRHVFNVFKTFLQIEERHPWFSQHICLRQISSKTCLCHVFSLCMATWIYSIINNNQSIKEFFTSSVLTFFLTHGFNFNLFYRANTMFASCGLCVCVTTSRIGWDKRWLFIRGYSEKLQLPWKPRH